MNRSTAAGRRWVWEDRLRRHAEGSLTVSEFCEREGVSVPSFYQWRRKLDGMAGQPGQVARKNATARLPPTEAFVPVQIRQSAAVEIRLPNGVQVWMSGGDAALLSTAIEAAGRLAGTSLEDAAC